LVSDHAEEVGSNRRAPRIVQTFRTKELQEALLHDIFGIRHRSSQPVCEAKQGQMMLVEQLQESGFPASSGCFDQIHACLNGITARGEKESMVEKGGAPAAKSNGVSEVTWLMFQIIMRQEETPGTICRSV
jgi:hypothetical protein